MVKDFDLVLERIQNLALACRKACEIMGLTIYPKVSSPSLSVIQMPELVDGQKVRLAMEEKFNITVIGGQDALKGKVVRIGHMGYITNEDLQETLIGLAGSINLQKPHCISEEKIQLALSAAQKILK